MPINRHRYRYRAMLCMLILLTFCLTLLARDWPVWSSAAFSAGDHGGPYHEGRPPSYKALRSSGTKPSVKGETYLGALILHRASIEYPRSCRVRQGNLHPHLRYLVTFYYAGFTNQVMMMMNREWNVIVALHARPLWADDTFFRQEIYLSQITDHIPVLSPFALHKHLHGNAAPLDPSTVFDLRRYSHEAGLPIVLLDELKNRRGSLLGPEDAEPEEEDLVCWGVQQTKTSGRTFNNVQISDYKFRESQRALCLRSTSRPLTPAGTLGKPHKVYRDILFRFRSGSMMSMIVRSPWIRWSTSLTRPRRGLCNGSIRLGCQAGCWNSFKPGE
jgi:hypothetical protein